MIQGFVITPAIKDIEDFHGFSNAIGNDCASFERNGSQAFHQIITRSPAMRRIANLAASRCYPADEPRGDPMALTG
jgi:hypothetical protein